MFKFAWVTILQGVEFPIFLLIFACSLQQCSSRSLPVIISYLSDTEPKNSWHFFETLCSGRYAITAVAVGRSVYLPVLTREVKSYLLLLMSSSSRPAGDNECQTSSAVSSCSVVDPNCVMHL